MKTKLTRDIAWAAAWDTANRNAKNHGRKKWTREDFRAGAAEFDRLWPLENDLPRIDGRVTPLKGG